MKTVQQKFFRENHGHPVRENAIGQKIRQYLDMDNMCAFLGQYLDTNKKVPRLGWAGALTN